MAVFRIEKQKNYTVMCNYHLQDISISLKAKGLLSLMLSLPENWDYTLRGLAAINKESVNTIGSIVNELIAAGYIVREQSRQGSGKFSGSEYVIFEMPQKKETEQGRMAENDSNTEELPSAKEEGMENTGFSPCHKKRDTVKRDTDSCDGNKVLNNKILNRQNKRECSYQSYQSGRLNDAANEESERKQEGDYEKYRDIVCENIGYEILLSDYPESMRQIEGIVNIILDVVMSKKDTIRIAKEEKPQPLVKSKFLNLNREHIAYVLYCLENNTTQVQDMLAYIRTALYNAPDTVQVYWQNKVMSNLYGTRDGPDEMP